MHKWLVTRFPDTGLSGLTTRQCHLFRGSARKLAASKDNMRVPFGRAICLCCQTRALCPLCSRRPPGEISTRGESRSCPAGETMDKPRCTRTHTSFHDVTMATSSRPTKTTRPAAHRQSQGPKPTDRNANSLAHIKTSFSSMRSSFTSSLSVNVCFGGASDPIGIACAGAEGWHASDELNRSSHAC